MGQNTHTTYMNIYKNVSLIYGNQCVKNMSRGVVGSISSKFFNFIYRLAVYYTRRH